MSAAISPINVQRSTVRTVSLDDITIDPKVQRQEGVDQRRVDKMAANFQPDALGLFILSQRPNGTLVCLDGMHRRAAALAAGWNQYVDARVFTGLTIADEAALFLLYNDKKDPSAISRFNARVLAGDEVAVEVNSIILKHGWRVSPEKTKPGALAAIDATERVYRSGSRTLAEGLHPLVLDRTLGLITGAWGHDPVGTHSSIIEGVGQLYGRFGDAIDTSKLVRELQDTSPRPLIGRAKSLRDIQKGTVPAAMAKLLVGLHNSKKRTNLLPEWVWVR
ncbi:MAG TPA: DUF6551 family protein [Jiangellaceae bacterium]|nr:DUF6551 family protein [Jiangellaceae bacterium]